MSKTRRRLVTARRKLAEVIINTIKSLRRKGEDLGSAWMRGDGFVRYLKKFWEPTELATHLALPI